MSKKWSDMDDKEKSEFMEKTDDEITFVRTLANEAFVRKSKMLTAGNAGGVLVVTTFFGAVTKEMTYFIILSLIIFVLGIIANGIVMYMSERRYNRYTEISLKTRKEFIAEDSNMTKSDREDQRHNEYKLLNKKYVSIEFIREVASGILFMIAVGVIIYGMVSYLDS